MRVIFACGHAQPMDPQNATPRCPCGETRIAGTRGVPAPRITGWARGPHAKTDALDPVKVTLAAKPMPLKDADDART